MTSAVVNLHEQLRDVFAQNSRNTIIAKSGRGSSDISYHEAAAFITALAEQVQDTSPDTRAIGILSNHKQETYIAVLAAYFLGIKFVPLNPKFPVLRLQRIIELADVGLILSDPSVDLNAYKLPAPVIVVELTSKTARSSTLLPKIKTHCPDAIAYQMFTSGTTGDPKGVPISYANLSAYVNGLLSAIDFPASPRCSQNFDLSFDLSIHDIFITLALGGTIVPPSQVDLLMPASYIQSKKLDVWFSVPLFAHIAGKSFDAEKHSHKLQMALFCGEALPSQYVELFSNFLSDPAELYNLYGPTEATIAFTLCRANDDALSLPNVPIGAVFGQNLVAIEGENGNILPSTEGAMGELLLGGPQVFDGYTPTVDKEVFVAIGGEKYYRSGDLVRFDKNGIYHLGRIDDQVKIRGYRIELGEIESAFRKTFPQRLCATFVFETNGAATIGLAYTGAEEIDNFAELGKLLPEYMMPMYTQRMNALPTNVNGKVDRRRLSELITND